MLPKICRQRRRGRPRAGRSTRYVGAIERGEVSASVTVLGQIAEALGSNRAICCGDPPEKAEPPR